MKIGKVVGLLFLTVLLGVLYGCTGSGSASTKYSLTLGETGDDGVIKESNEFKQGELVGLELEGKEAFKSSNLIILFFEHTGSTESIIAEFDETIDPTWNWYYNHYTGFDTGEYIIKIFNGEAELLAQKRFEVK